MEENRFDYANYIQAHLRDITDLDERRFAKELLLEHLGKIFAWTEEKYVALEERIQNDLKVSWENYNIFTTVIEKATYDPINNFWFPVCECDVRQQRQPEYETIYLKADEEKCKAFLKKKILTGTNMETGHTVRFKIEKSARYQECMKKLYGLFTQNHIPWQTVHMGHLDRFFDLIPLEDLRSDTIGLLCYGEWDEYIKRELMPVWNLERIAMHSVEYRIPCIDEVFYEHIFYISDRNSAEDGFLVETKEEIISIRYKKDKILLRTKEDTISDVFVHRVHQEKPKEVGEYQYPILSNNRKDSLAARYLQQTGNFIQTPMELNRKIEEMSGNYNIHIVGYEITEKAEINSINGDMNEFTGNRIFSEDKRKILLFRIHKAEEFKEDYLYDSQVRYILTQLQMEFLEYKCMGVFI